MESHISVGTYTYNPIQNCPSARLSTKTNFRKKVENGFKTINYMDKVSK